MGFWIVVDKLVCYCAEGVEKCWLEKVSKEALKGRRIVNNFYNWFCVLYPIERYLITLHYGGKVKLRWRKRENWIGNWIFTAALIVLKGKFIPLYLETALVLRDNHQSEVINQGFSLKTWKILIWNPLITENHKMALKLISSKQHADLSLIP